MPKGDKRQLKADIEDGYWKVANLVSVVLPLANLNGTQMRLLWALFDRTYRWHKKTAKIALDEWAAGIGVHSKSHVSTQLKQLIKKKVILREAEPGVTPTYEFNTKFLEWDPSLFSDYRTLQQSLNPSATTEQNPSAITEPFGTEEPNGDAALRDPLKNFSKELYKSSPNGDGKAGAKKRRNSSKPKVSDDAKAAAGHLKERLKQRGVTIFPRNWHIRANGIAQSMLSSGLSPPELIGYIDRCLDDPYWGTRTTTMDKVRDLTMQWQQAGAVPATSRKGQRRLGQRPKDADWEQDEELW